MLLPSVNVGVAKEIGDDIGTPFVVHVVVAPALVLKIPVLVQVKRDDGSVIAPPLRISMALVPASVIPFAPVVIPEASIPKILCPVLTVTVIASPLKELLSKIAVSAIPGVVVVMEPPDVVLQAPVAVQLPDVGTDAVPPGPTQYLFAIIPPVTQLLHPNGNQQSYIYSRYISA